MHIPKYPIEDRAENKPCPICGSWHSAMSSMSDFIILESPLVKTLRADIKRGTTIISGLYELALESLKDHPLEKQRAIDWIESHEKDI